MLHKKLTYVICLPLYMIVGLAYAQSVTQVPKISQTSSDEQKKRFIAQMDQMDSPVMLKPMVVSATLSEKVLEEAPGTVHLLNKDEIRVREVRRIGDVLRETPGIYIWGASQGSRAVSANRANRISIRGISGGARTLVLLDNQKMNDPSFGTLSWANLFPEDIERIEVIPGAASALYGGNAFAGVIRVVSKKPVKREVTLTGGYQFNTPEGGYGGATYRDKFKNGLAISAGYKFETSSGFRDILSFSDPARNQAGPAGRSVTGAIPGQTSRGRPTFQVGDHGKAPWNYHVGQFKAYYDFNAKTKISAGMRYFNSNVGTHGPTSYLRDSTGNTVISGPVNVNGTVLNPVSPGLFLNAKSHEADFRTFLDFEHQFSKDSKFQLNFGHLLRELWFTTVNRRTSRFDGGPGALVNAPQTLINGQGIYTFRVGESHFLTTGFQIEHGDLRRRDYSLSDWRDRKSRTARNLRANASTITTSFFFQDEMHLTDRLTAYLGTRLDWWTAEGKSTDFRNNVVKNTKKQSVVEISPKLALVYRAPWEGTVFRASAGRAFRPPTLQDLFVDSRRGINLSLSNTNLKPETALSWEVGWEQTIASTDTRFKATFFENRLFDIITRKTLVLSNTARESIRVNSASGITRGVELSLNQRLTDWLTLFSNYTWTPTAKTLSDPNNPITEGKRLKNTPKHLFTGGLEVNWKEWGGTLIGRHVGKSFDTAENLDFVHNVYGGFQSYWLLDTKIIYNPMRMLELSFAANNLLNAKYFQFTPNPGRNYVVQARLNFY